MDVDIKGSPGPQGTRGDRTPRARAAFRAGDQRAESDPRSAVLLVEPDDDVAAGLQAALALRAYTVQRASSGQEALALIEQNRPSLVALDLILPDTNGLVLLGDVKRLYQLPVIVLSRTQRRADAVLGFRLGADDFVSMPVDPDEFEARVNALLRRYSGRTPQGAAPAPRQTQVNDLVVDEETATATLAGVTVDLTPVEHRLLSALASRPDQTMTRQDLAERVWGNRDLRGSRALDMHIGRLRKKLRAVKPGGPAIIAIRLP